VPVGVVTGPHTPGHIVAAADAIARHVAGAEWVTDGDIVSAALAL
jgi:hypothetical protein